MHHRTRGYSLVELLVVVAVIATLAIAGLVAYGQYIDSTKDQSVLTDGQQIQKIIEMDVLRATQHSPNDTCTDLLDDVVGKLIAQNKTNPFTGTFLVQSTANNRILPRGGIYLACAFPNVKVGDPSFYIQTCVCTGSDCPLAPLPGVSQLLSTQVCYEL